MTKELFLANLDYDMTEEDIREILGHYGSVYSIRMLIPEGIAYVRFINQEDAILAIRSINGIDFLGHQIKIGWVETKSKNFNKAS